MKGRVEFGVDKDNKGTTTGIHYTVETDEPITQDKKGRGTPICDKMRLEFLEAIAIVFGEPEGDDREGPLEVVVPATITVSEFRESLHTGNKDKPPFLHLELDVKLFAQMPIEVPHTFQQDRLLGACGISRELFEKSPPSILEGKTPKIRLSIEDMGQYGPRIRVKSYEM